MPEHKTHWKTLHSPDYIGAYAFQPGEEIIATIKSVAHEDVMGVSGKKEQCMVVRFSESTIKPLICNVTNSKSISKAIGSPYIEDWAGHNIQMYTTEVSAFGDTVEAVRVRPKAPKLTKPDLTPDHPKFSGALESIRSGQTTVVAIRKYYTVSDEVAKLLETGEVA